MDFKGIFFNTQDFKLNERERLGKGNFGVVFTAENKNDHQKYACKIIEVEEMFDGNDQMQIMRESSILATLDHPAIVKFIGLNFRSFNDSSILQPAIITEYLVHGSLKAILDKEKDNLADFDWSPTKKYICLLGIASALKYLHEHGILHRDLKPENILMDENYYPKVGDFGLSRCFPESLTKSTKLTATSQIGTPLYMAPELFDDDTKYGQGVDVYAFAILAYEIITGKEPFYELGKKLNAITLLRKVRNGDRPSLSDDIPEKMKELLQKCWSQNVEERPSFNEIFRLLSSDFSSYSPEDVDDEEVQNYLETINDFSNNKGLDEIILTCVEIDRKQLKKSNNLQEMFQSALELGNTKIVEYLILNELFDINSKIIFYQII